MRFGRLGAVLAAFCLVSLTSGDASANSAMGLQGLGQAVLLVLGVAGLLLALVLGALSWLTILRPPTAVGWIFGRGFLGVSSVIAFALSGFCLLAASTSWAKGGFAGGALVSVSLLTCIFLVVEFSVAGTLYWRSARHRASWVAKLLSMVSFLLASVFALGACAVALLGIVALLTDGSKSMSAETKRYVEGCAKNRGTDCNMLGLRYRAGAEGLPRDSAKAAEAFQKACDLGAAIGCRNLATQYRSGDGVPKDEKRAAELTQRYEELRSKAPR